MERIALHSKRCETSNTAMTSNGTVERTALRQQISAKFSQSLGYLASSDMGVLSQKQ